METSESNFLRRVAAAVVWIAAAMNAAALSTAQAGETPSWPGVAQAGNFRQSEVPFPLLDENRPNTPVPNAPDPNATPGAGYFDLDQYVRSRPSLPESSTEAYYWQVLPDSLIYKSYLAGAKESRMAAKIINIRDQSTFWDATVGGRVGLFRYGTGRRVRPEGFQLDIEGSAQLRLDLQEEVDVQSVDFRGGIPLTFGRGPFQTKFGYYHLSSHVGDEFLLKNPNFNRLNFAQDLLVLGQSIYLTDKLRIYGEVAWGFYTIISEPWEFQFGVDYAPARPTGPAGAPFFAFNAFLRQEVNFGGNMVFQAGWAWRGDENARLLRVGLHYYNGESSQFSFFNNFEEQIGVGVWYDF